MYKTVIVIQSAEDPDIIEVWGTLTKVCKAHDDFSYHYLRRQKMPCLYKGWILRKVPLNPGEPRSKPRPAMGPAFSIELYNEFHSKHSALSEEKRRIVNDILFDDAPAVNDDNLIKWIAIVEGYLKEARK
jgi:hypothetical protein